VWTAGAAARRLTAKLWACLERSSRHAWPAPPSSPSHPLFLQVVPSSFEETLPKDSVTAAEYARLTALHKAQDVARSLAGASSSGQQLPALIIGADTVVEFGEHILEKPAGGRSSSATGRG